MKIKKEKDLNSTDKSNTLKSMKNILFVSALLLSLLIGCAPQSINEVETTYEDGSPKTVRTYVEEDGEKILQHEKSYYKTGELKMEGAYQNNKRHGKWVSYYKDGSKWAEATYENGKEEGMKIVYYKNGKVYYQGRMNAGERTGTWTFYDVEGGRTTINYDKKND